MNNLNNSVDDAVECPLCMEPLEVDDLNFFPCTCGYQICRFCWHRIRTDENELCPACRKEYPENPADFRPLTQEEMIAFKSQKRQRDQQRKQKITENRKHLANVRVVQKNLVFVVGLPPRLADADILKKHDYFGKYGKIHKVVINPSTAYAGVQGPSASAYVTYVHNADALRAIQSVNNITIDGRLIKTSLGTTKYCSHFMKNQQCPKGDCMYLHELGDPEASFTKEEMHQGKHQEYEKRLHDVLIASSSSNAGGCVASTNVISSTSSNNKGSEMNKVNSSVSNTASTASISMSTTSNSSSSICSAPQKEAWPSLSVSPINLKELSSSSGNKHKKDRGKQEKSKIEKLPKLKSNKHNSSNSLCKNGDISVTILDSILENSSTSSNISNEYENKSKIEKSKDRNQTKKETNTPTIEVETVDLAPNITSCDLNNSCKIKSENNKPKVDSLLSMSTSNNNRSSCIVTSNENNSIISENASGKITPESLNENSIADEQTTFKVKASKLLMPDLKLETKKDSNKTGIENLTNAEKYADNLFENNTAFLDTNASQNNNYSDDSKTVNGLDDNNSLENDKNPSNSLLRGNRTSDTIDSMSHLKLFDGNSFFSSTTDIISDPPQIKHIEDGSHNQLSCGNATNLPDLITGIDGYLNTNNEWEDALKSVMVKTNKQMEEKLQQNLHQQQMQDQTNKKYQEELSRIHEFQKHNVISSLNLSQLSGIQNGIQSTSNNYLTGSDLNRQSNFLQQQLHQHQSNQNLNENTLHNSLFGTNMSKFFDFHKHQQQKLQQHCLQMSAPNNLNGSIINESFHALPIIDNNLLNSHLVDRNSLSQHHKQNVFGKIDQILCHQTPPNNSQIGSSQSQQNQYMHSLTADDDLGFDPFIETQKALAELIENEEEQQNNGSSKLMPHNKGNIFQQSQQQHIMDYMQRARMPPPGFNNVNNLSGYSVVPRMQTNSKITPFMNLSNNYTSPSSQHTQHLQQQLQIPSNAWNTHLGHFSQHITEQQVRQVNINQIPSSRNQKACTGNDWTAMDPAILSFRQFSFPPQTQTTPQLQCQQQDMFIQLAQQQQQTGFNLQSQHLNGVGLPNTTLNSQPSAQPHVNANVQGMLEYLKTRQFV